MILVLWPPRSPNDDPAATASVPSPLGSSSREAWRGEQSTLFMTRSCWGPATRVRLPYGRPRRWCHQQCTSSASMCASRRVWRCHRYPGWDSGRLWLALVPHRSYLVEFMLLGLGDKAVTYPHAPALCSSLFPAPSPSKD